jgi:hypothetical protein
MTSPQPMYTTSASCASAARPHSSPPTSHATAKGTPAGTPNLPTPKTEAAAKSQSAWAPYSPASRAEALANLHSAPVFNFPHAHARSVGHARSGVGDSISLQPNSFPLAKRKAAAAFNLPAPSEPSTARNATAREGLLHV